LTRDTSPTSPGKEPEELPEIVLTPSPSISTVTKEQISKRTEARNVPKLSPEEFKRLFPELNLKKLDKRVQLAFRKFAAAPDRQKSLRDTLDTHLKTFKNTHPGLFDSENPVGPPVKKASNSSSKSQAPLSSSSSSSSAGSSYLRATVENPKSDQPVKLSTRIKDHSEFDKFLNQPPLLLGDNAHPSNSSSSSSPSKPMASSESSSSATGELSPSSSEHYFFDTLTSFYKQWFANFGRAEKEQKYVLSLKRSHETFIKSKFNLASLEEKLQKSFSRDDKPVDLQALARGWKGYWGAAILECVWSTGPKPLDLLAYCALKALNSPDAYSNIRYQYADFLTNLRDAFDTERYKKSRNSVDPLICLLEDLCYDKFTDTSLFDDWETFLEQLVKPVEGLLDFGSLSETLEEKNEKLHHTNSEFRKPYFTLLYEKLKGTLGINFDPVGKSNVPKKRSEQTVVGRVGEKDVHWKMGRIAHGTPTIEYDLVTKAWSWSIGASNAEIVPEYKAFLSAARRKKERVFYVNLQQRSGFEADRSNQTEKLQEDFKDTFYTMSLPMDGDFFEGLKKVDSSTKDFKRSTEDFKRNILGLFFDLSRNIKPESPAKFPLDLLERIKRKPELSFLIAAELDKIINQVHSLYFDGQNLNSPEDRQNFLMQFYSDLTDYMISRHYVMLDTEKELQKHERIRWVVQACKDNKDRGGAKNGIDEAKYVLLTYPLNDPKVLSRALYDIYVNTLGAYTIKFEEILSNRLVYFTSLLKRYAEIAKDLQKVQRIRDSQPEFFRIAEHKSTRYFDPPPP